MGQPAARIGDMHVCPLVAPIPHIGGPIASGESTVLIEGSPAARISDIAPCTCAVDVIAAGSGSVKIGGQPAARLGDATAHGGVIVAGAGTVTIGG